MPHLLYDSLKRGMDVVGAAGLLVVLSPVMGAVAVAVLGSMGRPVLYIEDRCGRAEVPFRILKFRTMVDRGVGEHELAVDDGRTTRLGAVLRKTSLDELPQLVNVLRGEMSLVGPRPLYMRYLDLYSPRQRRRHEARPGLTGWAQIHGRACVDWATKFELDLWYIEHRSLALDAWILARTVGKVIRAEGAVPVVAGAFQGAEPAEQGPRG